ncbi:MAG: alpha/beta hydrolase [Rhodospirillales bacterium]|nr:alpha/beta hydrolase [Rhodospirillales bacterium]
MAGSWRQGWLEVDGVRLEYARCGVSNDGAPTLVFLHEGLGCVALWKDFPERLAQATGCGAFVYSRAGYGRSDPAPLPRPVRFMHEEGLAVLPRVLEAAGIDRFVLVGHSDGASISIIYAGSGAARGLEGLILEAPHVFNEDISQQGIQAAKVAYETTELRRRLQRYHGDNVDCAFWGWNDVWLDPDFRAWNIEEFLPGITVPTLVIQGEADNYGTLEQVRAVERQAGAAVESRILPGCGHSPHAEMPSEALAAMIAFLESWNLTAGGRVPPAT